ncbi:UDP-2,4-diacetamido-2,4,6-trideoxy-beta-L-altropyranose hydrolase [Flavobacteriaceae bacterium S356]|uniref:UDP-2,4-diacetamido-2,4, 6-trideoxy-beta-L-altropyranose hydrolase n=1 Tax=Asprobacillus argus TaxID=3076534 RepID=A0ABU3LC58_9FLAO|nr:UDP-2,4-diacetamido-2,4,6-trideoxy-beta-L-altropyranose hydrolase [Flavobacteriaceae bacterium S356]
MKKTILFRADGNASSGLGHLYRLFSLVEIVRGKYDFVFITKENSALSVFPKTISTFLVPNSISIEEEIQWLKENFSSKNCIIIADGYQFTSAYQQTGKEEGFSVMYIDDLAQIRMFADVVVNHSPGLTPENYKKQSTTKLALGPDYALLRPTFLQLAETTRIISKIDTVFICFGGADPYNLTAKALEASLNVENIKTIHVVLGGAYEHSNMYASKKGYKKEVCIHRNLSEAEMAKVMLNSNVAIVPSSTILYELCCAKMPILSGYFVDNQERIYNGFLKEKAIFGLGNIKDFSTEDFKIALTSIIGKSNFEDLMVAQNKLFDSKIKERYLELIEGLC